jgi:hypothetical protein
MQSNECAMCYCKASGKHSAAAALHRIDVPEVVNETWYAGTSSIHDFENGKAS